MMKKHTHWLFYLLIGALVVSCAQSQYKSGVAAYEQYAYADAIDNLEKSLRKKPTAEAQLLLAESYLKVNRFGDAKNMFDLATLNPNVTDEARMHYGKALMSTRRYDDAQTVFDGVLSRDPSNKVAQALALSCRKTSEMTRDSALFKVDRVNLGTATAYGPVLAAGQLYFSAPAGSGLNDPYTNQPYTDIYAVDDTDGSWGNPLAQKALNSKFHDAVPAFSQDGNTAVFTRSLLEGGKRLAADGENTNNLQLYLSRKGAEGEWSEPELLPFNENGFMYTHPALSADGNTLYFASDKLGGMGGMDLYRTTWNGSAWSQPENLGGGVNTPGNEVFPSLKHADTLYFSSDAHLTLGGLDLMYATQTAGTWNPPIHLSAPVNSPADDFGMAFEGPLEGYISSDRSGTDQIYRFVELDPQIDINGLITDKNSMRPLQGVGITLTNQTDGTESRTVTDADGRFTFDLEPNKDYTVYAEVDDYFKVSQEISTIGITDNHTFDLPIELDPLIVAGDPDNPNGGDGSDNDDGSNKGDGSDLGLHNPNGVGQYPIHNIYWDYNKWDIRPDAEPYLDQLVKVLKDNPSLTVQIQSHCDCRGSNAFNDALSQKRAEAVMDYLVSKGIPRVKLQSKGMGKRKLVNKCNCRRTSCTEDQHSENRRTEFVVISK